MEEEKKPQQAGADKQEDGKNAGKSLLQEELLEATVLLASRVKAIEGLDTLAFVKSLNRQKEGLELAKALYVELLKALTTAGDKVSNEALVELEAELQALTLEQLKAKVTALQPSKTEEQAVKAEANEGNPLVGLLQEKQYKQI